MIGAEHYTEAENILSKVSQSQTDMAETMAKAMEKPGPELVGLLKTWGEVQAATAVLIARAQAHATLALAAATVDIGYRVGPQ